MSIPPIELPWMIARSIPSASMNTGKKRAFARTREALARGGTVRPKPGRSTAMTSRSSPSAAMTSNQLLQLPPRPCTKRCGTGSPPSATLRPPRTTCADVPRTSTKPLCSDAHAALRAPRSPRFSRVCSLTARHPLSLPARGVAGANELHRHDVRPAPPDAARERPQPTGPRVPSGPPPGARTPCPGRRRRQDGRRPRRDARGSGRAHPDRAPRRR